MRKDTNDNKNMITNRETADSGAKLIFGNHTLCAQLLQDYSGMELLKDVRPEDIEDVTTRYIPMFTGERDSDTVKRVKLREKGELFVITLIEHKSYVDYNVIMQMLRYMVFIWEDYAKQKEAEQAHISKTKGFKYPPILPIVYYEGKKGWTAVRSLSEKIFLSGAFSQFIPDFQYLLVNLSSMDTKEILSKDNELSLVMLINKLKSTEEYKKLNLPENYLEEIAKKAPADVLDVIARVVAVMLRGLHVPEDELQDFTDRIRSRKMGKLFADFEFYDVQATRKEIQDLKDENSGLKDKVSGLTDKVSDLTDENSDLKDENSGLKDENSGLKDENSDLKDENSNLKDENSDLKDENIKLRKLLEENGIVL